MQGPQSNVGRGGKGASVSEGAGSFNTDVFCLHIKFIGISFFTIIMLCIIRVLFFSLNLI